MRVDLNGRTAIVTGAGRGIGETIAVEFAKLGADVVAASRTSSEIDDTIERVEDHGARGLAVPTDLRSVSDIDELVDAAAEEFGAPDTLVNNAAQNLGGDTLERSVEDVDLMIDVNFRGVFLLSQRFAQEFAHSSREYGRIINISSVHGRLGTRSRAVYAGTNSAIYGLTRGLASELSPFGVTVNSVSPGLTKTDRIAELIDEAGEELYDLDEIPLGRLGDPEDVSDACVFLASEYADYVTGADLPVDGGVAMTAGLYNS